MPLAAIVHNFLAGWVDEEGGRGPSSTALLDPGSRTRTQAPNRADVLCASDTSVRPTGTTRTSVRRSGSTTF